MSNQLTTNQSSQVPIKLKTPKTIGLIGGMSWESSLEYYRILNTLAKHSLGGVHSAPILLDSLDFGVVEELQSAENWTRLDELMANHAQVLARVGAQVIGLSSNTMHRCWPKVIEALESDQGREQKVQAIHIVQPVGEYARTKGWKTLGLLGTKFTMEGQDYPNILANDYGISVITPHPDQRALVHRVIYQELVVGVVAESSRKIFLAIIEDLSNRGAVGIILGCTEIPLIVQQNHTPVPLLDTTDLHCQALWDAATR
jgi:aspartate racemase